MVSGAAAPPAFEPAASLDPLPLEPHAPSPYTTAANRTALRRPLRIIVPPRVDPHENEEHFQIATTSRRPPVFRPQRSWLPTIPDGHRGATIHPWPGRTLADSGRPLRSSWRRSWSSGPVISRRDGNRGCRCSPSSAGLGLLVAAVLQATVPRLPLALVASGTAVALSGFCDGRSAGQVRSSRARSR